MLRSEGAKNHITYKTSQTFDAPGAVSNNMSFWWARAENNIDCRRYVHIFLEKAFLSYSLSRWVLLVWNGREVQVPGFTLWAMEATPNLPWSCHNLLATMSKPFVYVVRRYIYVYGTPQRIVLSSLPLHKLSKYWLLAKLNYHIKTTPPPSYAYSDVCEYPTDCKWLCKMCEWRQTLANVVTDTPSADMSIWVMPQGHIDELKKGRPDWSMD